MVDGAGCRQLEERVCLVYLLYVCLEKTPCDTAPEHGGSGVLLQHDVWGWKFKDCVGDWVRGLLLYLGMLGGDWNQSHLFALPSGLRIHCIIAVVLVKCWRAVRCVWRVKTAACISFLPLHNKSLPYIMSDFENDIDDELLELAGAGATEKKRKRRQGSSSKPSSKRRKAE